MKCWFFSLFSFLFVVKVEGQLPSSLYVELETRSPLNFSRSLFNWKWLCVCYMIPIRIYIFQIRLFYTVWVTVYRVLSPRSQLCKVLPLFFIMLSSQQLWKVILIFQTRTASDMYTLRYLFKYIQLLSLKEWNVVLRECSFHHWI